MVCVDEVLKVLTWVWVARANHHLVRGLLHVGREPLLLLILLVTGLDLLLYATVRHFVEASDLHEGLAELLSDSAAAGRNILAVHVALFVRLTLSLAAVVRRTLLRVQVGQPVFAKEFTKHEGRSSALHAGRGAIACEIDE